MTQLQVEKTIHIKAPVGRIFRYIDTPENFQEFCPNVIEIKDVEQLSRMSKRFVWTIKLMDARFVGVCRYLGYKFGQHISCELSGGILGQITWLFESTADGTRTTLKVEYKAPRPLLKRYDAEQIVQQSEHNIQKILDTLKSIIETNKEAVA